MATAAGKPERTRTRRWQISVRGMLVLLTAAALIAAGVAWWIKPRDTLHIQLAADGRVWVEGQEVSPDELARELERVRIDKVSQGVSPGVVRVHVHVAEEARYEDLLVVLHACTAQSFELFRYHVDEQVFAMRIPAGGDYLQFPFPQMWMKRIHLEANSQGMLANVQVEGARLPDVNALRQHYLQLLQQEPLRYDNFSVFLKVDDQMRCRHVFEAMDAVTFREAQPDGTARVRKPQIYPISTHAEIRMPADYQVDVLDLFEEQWSESEWTVPKRGE